MSQHLRPLGANELSYVLAQRIAREEPRPTGYTEEEYWRAVFETPTGSDPAKRLEHIRLFERSER